MSTTEEAERSSIEGGIMSTPSLDGVNHSITTHDLDLDHGTSAPFFVAPPTDETCVPNQISAAASAADGPNGDDNPFPLPAFGLASTGTGGGLPSVDETRRININELIAELNSANGSGNINLRELETIMISKEADKKAMVKAGAEGRASEELPFSLPPPPSGPELIHDNVGPLNPLATLDSGPGYMIKMKERKGFLEQIHDNDGPPDLTEMLSTIEDSDIAKKINDGQAIHSAAGDHELGLKPKANELSPPVPLNLIKARFNNNCVQNQQREDDSICIPTRDEIETDDTEPFAITRTPSTVRRRGADSREMIENNPAVSDGDIENASAGVGGALDRAIVHERDPNGSLQIIPEAFLVEENDHGVISGYAEPLLPWWRQKRTKLLLVLVFIIVTIMSVVIGLSPSWSSSQPGSEQIFLTKTYPPTSSAVPTMEQSSPPSLSTIPSYSPTACSYTISTGMQKLNMPLESLYGPNFAIDGRNMVVTAQDSKLDYVYVMFYSLEGNHWNRSDKYFITETESFRFWGYPVALSGGTAFVGFKNKNAVTGNVTGGVYSYELLGDGLWYKVVEPIVLKDGRGRVYTDVTSVNIDSNLACVTAWRKGKSIDNIFRRDESSWEIIESLDFNRAEECHVAGNTITVRYSAYSYYDYLISLHQYDTNTGSVAPLQEELAVDGEPMAVSLSNSYLIYSVVRYTHSEPEYEVYVYHRREQNLPFILLQRFKSTKYGEGFGSSLAMDKDALVIDGVNQTYIFSEQNGYFEHALTFQRNLTTYSGWRDSGSLLSLSGRSVIAKTYDDVYSFNIEDCTQSLPTQTPSVSSAPSSTSSPNKPTAFPTYPETWFSSGVLRTTYPTDSVTRIPPPTYLPTKSFKPSESKVPSLSSSASILPTETCYLVDVSIDYDDHPEETTWEVLRIVKLGSNETFKTHRGESQEVIYTQSFCLPEGRYQFTIRDWDGICCDDGEGKYILSSYGVAITQGAKFERKEIALFDIPFDSNLFPSQTPSKSLLPSLTTSPSQRPSPVSSSVPSLSPSSSMVPSLSPSSSMAPTKSSSPTDTPSSSMAPTKSSSPTETCHRIGIAISFDTYPTDISWDIHRIHKDTHDSNVSTLIRAYGEGNAGATSYTGSLCLPEGGRYQFSIHDIYGDGLCCGCGEGHYNVTLYDDVIVQGGDFASGEMTIFDIPFNETSVVTTSITLPPMTPHPKTPFPTIPPHMTPWLTTPRPTTSNPTSPAPSPATN